MSFNINEVKSKIYNCIITGSFGEEVINTFLHDDGSIIPLECELWDFKEKFEGTNDSYLKLVKTIISLYNSFGGYVVYGIKEKIKDTSFSIEGIGEDLLIDQQKVRGLFDKHVGRRIDILYDNFSVECSGVIKSIGLLYVPKRPSGLHSASVIKAAALSNNKELLKKDCTYFRCNDESKQCLNINDFEFISGDRDFLLLSSGGRKRKKLIDHDLPDKNFICARFIGRFEILNQLWSWLGDEFQYAKVLAGEGGKGKTSIAYEFCQLLAKSGASSIDQIVWLTAKKKQFKGLYDSYIETPESHYDSLETLLKEVCLKTGSLDEELIDLSENQLKRKAKENLESYPTFIVVDDVDSNSPDEQRRIMEAARVIANSNSRVLLTTRVNNIYSTDSCITVPGLEGSDYSELVNVICDRVHLQKLNLSNIEKLCSASEGSPLFTESILRLYKNGVSLNVAIEQWSGEEGELVREAALRKEIEELTLEAIKILVAVSYVGGCSRTEVHQLTELSNSNISTSIEQLGNLFLIQSINFIEEEPRIEVSSSVSNLILKLCHEILPDASDYIDSVRQIAEGLRYQELSNGNVPEVGAAVRQCSALLKNESFNQARETVRSLLGDKKFKENSDLFFMLARVEYDDPSSSLEVVRKSFNDAYIKGQRKESFFDMWYEVENQIGEQTSISNVCKDAIEQGGFQTAIWYERYANSQYLHSGDILNRNSKIHVLVNAYGNVTKAISMGSAPKWSRIKDLSVNIVDSIWKEAMLEDNYLVAFKAMSGAINAGDVRQCNYVNAAEAVQKLFAVHTNRTRGSFSEELRLEARDQYQESRDELRCIIDNLDLARHDLRDRIEQMVFRVPDA
ncbi:NB-ARC domain-containing protein [Neptuniibacter sp. QD48_55]|uniref:NB-ARC domain-containing protein n=1 Tax=Neptuniibacter sp. QD48_55 TaxID=3398212 RepID=UPI0039F638A4